MFHLVLIDGVRLTQDTKITEAMKKLPWMWTGFTRKVNNSDLPHTGKGNPVRFFFQHYIRKLEMKERLIRDREFPSLDVNPWHYSPTPHSLLRSETQDVVQDVAPTPPEAQFGDPASIAHLQDLVDALLDTYSRTPFQTWDEYYEAMKDIFVGVLPRDQVAALARIGINLRGDPHYVS
jgi:hypothetical protein